MDGGVWRAEKLSSLLDHDLGGAHVGSAARAEGLSGGLWHCVVMAHHQTSHADF